MRASPSKLMLLGLSKTAPAVLGRESLSIVVLSVRRPVRGFCGLEVPALMTDERLLVAECPRIVDMEVSVSDEMVERGRIYSTLSEKPTRARDGGRGVVLPSSSGKQVASRKEGCEMDLFTECPKVNELPSDGVAGALPDRAAAGGFMMEDKS